MTHIYKKGFTLIELLVVVAIIGILALVVTASLGSARSKSKDASIQSTFKNINIAAELWLLDYDTYFITKAGVPNSSGQCSDSYALTRTFFMEVQDMFSEIDSLNGSQSLTCRIKERSNGQSFYAIHTKLSDGTDVCIDGTGVIRSTIVNSGSDLYCI